MRCRFSFAGWLVFSLSLLRAVCAAAPEAGDHRVTLTLHPTTGEVRLQEGDLVLGGLGRWAGGKAGIEAAWGRIEGVDATNRFRLLASNAGVELTLEGSRGWVVRHERGSVAEYRVDGVQGLVDVSCLGPGTNGITIAYPDGARGWMGPGATARYDPMRDGSYTVVGRGGRYESVDGESLGIAPGAWMGLGGGLTEGPAAPGARVTRRTPVLAVLVAGTLGGEVAVETAGQRVALAAGERKELTFTNGAVLRLEQRIGARALAWEVVKGHFRFTLGSAPGWVASGMTGQRGELVWDNGSRIVDLKNTGGETELFVGLPGGSFVRVPVGALFQFAAVDSVTFATSATGGAVMLYNGVTREVVALAASNRLFRNGRLAGSGTTAPGTRETVTVTWGAENAVELRGSGGVAAVQPGAAGGVSGPGGTELKARNLGDEGVALTAEAGNFRVEVPVVVGLAIELSQGDGVTLRFDGRSQVLVLRTPEQNSDQVRAALDERFSPLLPPSSSMTFMLGTQRRGAGIGEGGLVFFEAAGAGAAGGAGLTLPRSVALSPLFAPPSTDLEVSRIPQPPLSGLR